MDLVSVLQLVQEQVEVMVRIYFDLGLDVDLQDQTSVIGVFSCFCCVFVIYGNRYQVCVEQGLLHHHLARSCMHHRCYHQMHY